MNALLAATRVVFAPAVWVLTADGRAGPAELTCAELTCAAPPAAGADAVTDKAMAAMRAADAAGTRSRMSPRSRFRRPGDRPQG